MAWLPIRQVYKQQINTTINDNETKTNGFDVKTVNLTSYIQRITWVQTPLLKKYSGYLRTNLIGMKLQAQWENKCSNNPQELTMTKRYAYELCRDVIASTAGEQVLSNHQ